MPSYDTPYGWRLSPILAGTGGEVELSKDAQEMFSDPDTYNLLVMDWDIFKSESHERENMERTEMGDVCPRSDG